MHAAIASSCSVPSGQCGRRRSAVRAVPGGPARSRRADPASDHVLVRLRRTTTSGSASSASDPPRRGPRPRTPRRRRRCGPAGAARGSRRGACSTEVGLVGLTDDDQVGVLGHHAVGQVKRRVEYDVMNRDSGLGERRLGLGERRCDQRGRRGCSCASMANPRPRPPAARPRRGCGHAARRRRPCPTSVGRRVVAEVGQRAASRSISQVGGRRCGRSRRSPACRGPRLGRRDSARPGGIGLPRHDSSGPSGTMRP